MEERAAREPHALAGNPGWRSEAAKSPLARSMKSPSEHRCGHRARRRPRRALQRPDTPLCCRGLRSGVTLDPRATYVPRAIAPQLTMTGWVSTRAREFSVNAPRAAWIAFCPAVTVVSKRVLVTVSVRTSR